MYLLDRVYLNVTHSGLGGKIVLVDLYGKLEKPFKQVHLLQHFRSGMRSEKNFNHYAASIPDISGITPLEAAKAYHPR